MKISQMILIVLTFLVSISSFAYAESKVEYTCPYLKNEKWQKLDSMTQGLEGWFFRDRDFKERYTLLPGTLNYLRRMVTAFEKEGKTLILTPVPPRVFVAHHYLNMQEPLHKEFDLQTVRKTYQAYIQQLKSTGALVADVSAIADKKEAETHARLMFKRDQHWTPYGARVVAQEVAKQLQEVSAYKQATRFSYKTEKLEENRLASDLTNEISRLCRQTMPPETFPLYRTSMQATDGASQLFDDGEEIALLGSSFSDLSIFNFAGFLSEATGLNVSNYAISAGKLYNSIVSYITLPVAKRKQAKFILWEMLAHYDLNKGEPMYRQIIPAIAGECQQNEALAHKKVSFNAGEKKNIITLDKRKNVTGSAYYLFIESDNPIFSKFTVEFEYAGGDGEWFEIEQNENYRNNKRFFIELNDEITDPLTSVNVEGITPIDTVLNVRLCKAN